MSDVGTLNFGSFDVETVEMDYFLVGGFDDDDDYKTDVCLL